jgi:hypothetical protein
MSLLHHLLHTRQRQQLQRRGKGVQCDQPAPNLPQLVPPTSPVALSPQMPGPHMQETDKQAYPGMQ